MGHEPLTKCIVLAVAVCFRHTQPMSPWFILCAYVIGGTANHNLFLAIHEITHNLEFKGVSANKALAIFANLPIGIPCSTAFKVQRNNSRLRGAISVSITTTKVGRFNLGVCFQKIKARVICRVESMHRLGLGESPEDFRLFPQLVDTLSGFVVGGFLVTSPKAPVMGHSLSSRLQARRVILGLRSEWYEIDSMMIL
jgi:hypothetical protein